MISTYLYLSDYLKTPLSTWAQLLLTHQVGSSIIITHSRMNYLLIFLTDFKSTPTPPGQTFIASKFSLSSPYVPPPFRDPGHPRIDNKYLMKQLVVNYTRNKCLLLYFSRSNLRSTTPHNQELSQWQMQEQNNSRRSAASRPSWPASRVTRSTLSCGSAAS